MRKSFSHQPTCLPLGKLYQYSIQLKMELVQERKIPVPLIVDPNYLPTSVDLQQQNTAKSILDSGHVLILPNDKLKIKVTLFMILKSLGHSSTKCN